MNAQADSKGAEPARPESIVLGVADKMKDVTEVIARLHVRDLSGRNTNDEVSGDGGQASIYLLHVQRPPESTLAYELAMTSAHVFRGIDLRT
jgi:S-formylglutathione hydrolase FrmB